MAVALALASAAVFALGTVLQQREAMEDPDAQSGSAGVLLRLARRPVWLAGVTAYGVGFGLQAAALGVPPARRRVPRRDVIAACVVTAGLGLFLLLSDPGGGRDDAPIAEWVLA